MKKGKFFVDYCFEAGVDHICQRYWFEIEMTEDEFEKLYQVWFDNDCELNSWDSDWQGYDEMYRRIDSATLDGHTACPFFPRSVRLIGDFVFGPGGGKIVVKDR